MPYIPKSKKDYFDPLIMIDDDLTHPGTLNYLFTKLILKYQTSRGKGWSDEVLDEVYGALFYCMLELDRRRGKDKNEVSSDVPDEESYTAFNNYGGKMVRYLLTGTLNRNWTKKQMGEIWDQIVYEYHTYVAPYEDKKIHENGDVYE